MVKEKIHITMGDITKLEVDAIVNAANSSLLGGGGVDGAIHKAAGPELLKACEELNGCATGQAKLTRGYQLPAKYIIHTVGPVWRGGAKGEHKLLTSCYANAFKIALQNDVRSIAFPAISCGVYGYPVSQASTIAIQEAVHFLEKNPELEKVFFVCFDESIYEAYQNAIEALVHE